jgi:KDO2-lipid IV(A) lauroyltransferase
MESTASDSDSRHVAGNERAVTREERMQRKIERRSKKLRTRRLQARLVFAGLALARVAPGWLWNGIIAKLAVICAPRFLRRTADEQLSQAFGTCLDATARRRIVRSMLLHHARSVREFAQLRRADAAYVRRMVVPEVGFGDRVRALLQGGNGLVMVTPHFGNYELIPAWMTQSLGVRLAAVGKHIVNPWIDAELVAMRWRHGVETIYQDESARKLLRLLASGGIVGILPDPDIVKLPGIFVDFFGRAAWTTPGPAHLSLHSGAPLVAVFLRWEGDRYRLSLGEPVFPDRSAPRDAEIRRITMAWSAAFERAISASPDHWVWFHRRWRTTPERIEKRRRQGRIRPVRVSPPDPVLRINE